MHARSIVLRVPAHALFIKYRWQVEIFSAEGDVLHQYFDCTMLGALGSVDIWPAAPGLERPTWSRQPNGSSSREFELPCAFDQLKLRTGARDDQVRDLVSRCEIPARG